MFGLSTTAIGGTGRDVSTSLSIYRELQGPLSLGFLELAIGVYALTDDPVDVPIVLHDSCLYKREEGRLNRLILSPLNREGWGAYRDYISSHDVLAISIHPPKVRECGEGELLRALTDMEGYFNIPVLLEVMPSPEYWHSRGALLDFPTLLDVSHVNIWCEGSAPETEAVSLGLLEGERVKALHLSHNKGKKDSHDMVPPTVWWWRYLPEWNRYLTSWESLPVRFAEYERTDKHKGVRKIQ